MEKNEPQKEGLMTKVATFIVDKRNLFFLLTILSVIFTMFSRNWVEVENDMASYLPPASETRQGLDVMEEQFTTFGTARVMVSNITLDTAWDLESRLSKLEGVQSIAFDDTADHYAHASALYEIDLRFRREGPGLPGHAGNGQKQALRL